MMRRTDRQKKFASFYAECATEFKSRISFSLASPFSCFFALLDINYMTAINWEFSEAETRLSQRLG